MQLLCWLQSYRATHSAKPLTWDHTVSRVPPQHCIWNQPIAQPLRPHPHLLRGRLAARPASLALLCVWLHLLSGPWWQGAESPHPCRPPQPSRCPLNLAAGTAGTCTHTCHPQPRCNSTWWCHDYGMCRAQACIKLASEVAGSTHKWRQQLTRGTTCMCASIRAGLRVSATCAGDTDWCVQTRMLTSTL
jgi:hypothetical protein